MSEVFERNQLIMDKKANHYTYMTLVKRFTDEFQLKNSGEQIRFQQFMSEDILAKSGFKTDKKIGYKELTKRLDSHISKTLTDSLRNHLEQLSKRVLKFISQEYTKVQSAQFQWIIARKESDGGKEVSQIQLIDIKNVIFINDSTKPKTLAHQELMSNLLYGKKIKNKTKGFKERYNSVGKYKSINLGVYGQHEKDNERFSNLISNYECVLDSKKNSESRI